MKKFYKVLSAAALGAIFATGVVATASCDGGSNSSQQNISTLDSAVKMLEASITNNGDKISTDFELPATVTEYGKTYDVAWVSEDTSILSFTVAYRDDGTKYIKTIITRAVDEEGKEQNPEYAVATYHAVLTDRETNERKDSSDFRVRILKVVPASVTYAKWIDGSQTNFDISGYVLAKVGYNESYKEANIIVWDDEAKGAYFVYQAYLDKDVYDALEGGEKISVTGAVRKPYNGLLETQYGATATVDKNATKLDISTLGTDITSLIKGYSEEANQAALMKLQSSKVSLKQVKVVSKNEKVQTTDGKYDTTMTTVVTVSVGEQQLDVALYQGFTAFSADSTKSLVSALQAKVGQYVNLEGYLSWNSNGPVFIINDASKIVDSSEPADDKVLADIVSASKSFEAAYATTPEAITLPKTGATNSSELSYAVSGEGAKLEDNVLTLTVGETKTTVTVTITGKIGDTTISKEYTIALGVNDEDIAKEVADAVKFNITNAVTRETLSTGDADKGVEFTWAVKDSANGVAEIKDGKLYLVATTKEAKPVLTLTAKKGEATYSRDIEITVPAYTLTSLAKVAEGKNDSDAALEKDKSYVCVEGYVSQSMTSGNWYLSTEKNDTKTLLIYYVQDKYAQTVSNVNDLYPVGTKVTLWGLYTEYKTTKELKNAVVLAYEISDDVKAQNNVNTAASKFGIEYNETTEIELPEGVSATVTAGNTVTVAGNKVTITPTTTSEEVKIKLTSTVGSETKEKEVTFTSVITTSTKVTVTSKTRTENKNLENGTVTDEFNVDDKITLSVANNDATTNLCLATNGEIRLYGTSEGNGNSLTISVASGYAIKSITITYANGYTGATVSGATNTPDTTVLTAKYTLSNAQSVTIQNKKKSGQVRITSIVVEYDTAA